jgi:hypothetical protein
MVGSEERKRWIGGSVQKEGRGQAKKGERDRKGKTRK